MGRPDQNNVDKIFLALVLWREARGASDECKTAIAYSVLNRVEHPKWWGTTVQDVLFKREQYSSMTHKGDVQLATWPISKEESWLRCIYIASDVIDKVVMNPTTGADSYYDTSIDEPEWAKRSLFVKQIDNVRFYNTDKDSEDA